MSAEKVFKDTIFLNSIFEYGAQNFGYSINDDYVIRIYKNYFAPEKFQEFINEMKNVYLKAYTQYESGAGQELFSKSATPPKMACCSSSSRFCYLALRDGEDYFNSNKGDFVFEQPCPIEYISNEKISQPPHLDAYLPSENIYIESKCQEIFNQHTTKMKKAYWDYINRHKTIVKNDIQYNVGFNLNLDKEALNVSEFEIPYEKFGFTSKKEARKEYYFKHFDFKQFLCHLLGIACENIRNNITGTDKKSTLCYMFFKPLSNNQEINAKINKVFRDLEKEIEIAFNNTYIKTFCTDNNITLKAIAEHSKIMEPLSQATNNVNILY